jgi:hypothetical protein
MVGVLYISKACESIKKKKKKTNTQNTRAAKGCEQAHCRQRKRKDQQDTL